MMEMLISNADYWKQAHRSGTQPISGVQTEGIDFVLGHLEFPNLIVFRMKGREGPIGCEGESFGTRWKCRLGVHVFNFTNEYCSESGENIIVGVNALALPCMDKK